MNRTASEAVPRHLNPMLDRAKVDVVETHAFSVVTLPTSEIVGKEDSLMFHNKKHVHNPMKATKQKQKKNARIKPCGNSRKLRILALHGYGQQGSGEAGFSFGKINKRLNDRLKDIAEIVYPDAPHDAKPVGKAWFIVDYLTKCNDPNCPLTHRRTGGEGADYICACLQRAQGFRQYKGWSASLQQLVDLSDKMGPFDG